MVSVGPKSRQFIGESTGSGRHRDYGALFFAGTGHVGAGVREMCRAPWRGLLRRAASGESRAVLHAEHGARGKRAGWRVVESSLLSNGYPGGNFSKACSGLNVKPLQRFEISFSHATLLSLIYDKILIVVRGNGQKPISKGWAPQ